MKTGNRTAAWVVQVGTMAGATALIGCRSEPAPLPQPAPSSSDVIAPDELRADELREGTSVAFGLALPAVVQIEAHSPSYIRARGRGSLEAVSNFVRRRVDAEAVLTGPSKTTFDNVTVKTPKGQPRDAGPNDRLRVEIATARGETTITCTIYHPVSKPGLTEDQRWEQNGLTKDGKPVDPKKFE